MSWDTIEPVTLGNDRAKSVTLAVRPAPGPKSAGARVTILTTITIGEDLVDEAGLTEDYVTVSQGQDDHAGKLRMMRANRPPAHTLNYGKRSVHPRITLRNLPGAELMKTEAVAHEIVGETLIITLPWADTKHA